MSTMLEQLLEESAARPTRSVDVNAIEGRAREMRRRARAARLGAAGVILAILVVAGTVLFARDSSTVQTPLQHAPASPEGTTAYAVECTASVESKTPALPEKLELMVAQMAAAFDFPMAIANDGEEPLYLSREDFVRQQRAIFAQKAGLEFEPSELLAPLCDADGKLVAYRAMNVNGRISVEEARSPDFDLCARQAADTPGDALPGCK